ncbi:hypothetical protein CC80DRAFT_494241 [Byssothecium circinans]|uniref:Uncharacterized protein n=1 Tax=Byssothecium circinans TaxID=147558 RepID=A0A6A5TPV1_9PLEO|nr:hypothetical protein CC80DRAFT_494241 [Byssothecium circinans]
MLPGEIRNAIFEEVFISEATIHRGAEEFGPLAEQEKAEIEGTKKVISWQLLCTCRQYYEEAFPLLYAKNSLALCTGKNGAPGKVGAFPLTPTPMSLIKNVRISFRLDNPDKPAAGSVAKFLDAIVEYSTIDVLRVTIASVAHHFDETNPWNILMMDHPVIGALERVMRSGAVRNLAIRLHDGAFLSPDFSRYLSQELLHGHHLIFLRSCSCHTYDSARNCIVCGMSEDARSLEPIQRLILSHEADASPEMVDDCQYEILQRL